MIHLFSNSKYIYRFVIAYGIFTALVLVFGVYLMLTTKSKPQIPDIFLQEGAVAVSQEAEQGLLTRLTKFTNASKDRTQIYAPAGLAEKAGVATYQFNLMDSGNYLFEAIVYATNTSGDSWYIQLDDRPIQVWDYKMDVKFVYGSWVKVNLGALAIFQNLSAGPHTLKFFSREPNARIDKWSLTLVKITATPRVPTPRPITPFPDPISPAPRTPTPTPAAPPLSPVPLTPTPLPYPGCSLVKAEQVVMHPSTFCMSGQSQGASFRCMNGTTGTLTQLTCYPSDWWQKFAEHACNLKTSCTSPMPAPMQNVGVRVWMMDGGTGCDTNASTRLIYECSNNMWGELTSPGCQDYQTWQNQVIAKCKGYQM